jgi:hypothetical protein
MMAFQNVAVRIVTCCGALALIGCGPDWVDDLPREAISGRVTVDGAPLARGTIAFRPTADLPTPAMVPVDGGSYSIPRAQGLVPGSYEVSILASEDPVPAEKFDDPPGLATRKQTEATDSIQRAKRFGGASGKTGASPNQRIPARYNTATTLSAEVKKGSSNSFDFVLTSAPTPQK